MTNHRYYKRQSEKIFDAYEYWYLQDQKYSKQNSPQPPTPHDH